MPVLEGESSQFIRQSTPKPQRNITPSRSTKTPLSKSRTKLLLLRQHTNNKETFLTDPQTSDNTAKSSTQSSTNLKTQLLQEKIRRLTKQNRQLKQNIINLKANQFYTINEQKVKQAIQQNQKLKLALNSAKLEIQQLKILNQYLQRNHKNLKQIWGEDVRKSVDLSKSRGKNNGGDTSRTIVKKDNTAGECNKQAIGKMNRNNHRQNLKLNLNGILKINNDEQNQIYKPFFQQKSSSPMTRNKRQTSNSSSIHNKKSVNHIKSNPNILRYYSNKQNLNPNNQQSNNLYSFKQRFESSQKQKQKKAAKEILKECSSASNYNFIKGHKSSESNEYKQNQYNQSRKRNSNNNNIYDERPTVSRSRSKQVTLQAILIQKAQMFNRNNSKQNNNNHEKVSQNKPSCYKYQKQSYSIEQSKQDYNQQYLIGRQVMRNSSPTDNREPLRGHVSSKRNSNMMNKKQSNLNNSPRYMSPLQQQNVNYLNGSSHNQMMNSGKTLRVRR